MNPKLVHFREGARLLNYSDTAAWLSIKPETLRRWVMQRRIPFKKIGRIVRFDPDELSEWVEACSVRPTNGEGCSS